MILTKLISGFLYLLPAYFANSSPTILGKGTPIDFNRKFYDDRRILGDHKTWWGLCGGISIGTAIGGVIFLLGTIVFPYSRIPGGFGLFDSLLRALLLSVGTHIGDLMGSFIKRRLGITPGNALPVFDQIGFFLFAILLASPFYWFGWLNFGIWFVITLGIHPLFNLIAWMAGIQEDIL